MQGANPGKRPVYCLLACPRVVPEFWKGGLGEGVFKKKTHDCSNSNLVLRKRLKFIINLILSRRMLLLFPIVTSEKKAFLILTLTILYESILSCALAEFFAAGSSSTNSRLQIDVRTVHHF
jgi:hypothetical protein